jgi:monoamine oxidase
VPVVILEARDRIGGRVYTQRAAGCEAPIELGAEFIHGKSPEVWKLLEESGKKITEVDGDSWCVEHQKVRPCDFFSSVDDILKKMEDSTKDESFLDFLERRFPNRTQDPRLERAKQHAIQYVSGFNAADPALVGVHWLVQEMRAEEKIEGDRAFRAEGGYDDLLEIFRRQLKDLEIHVHTNSVVENIEWQGGRAKVKARSDSSNSMLSASSILLTVPLSILKLAPGNKGAIQFDPPLPSEKLKALDKLEMGEVIRVVLQFRERFWETIRPDSKKTLADMSFFFTEDDWFPTWWTSMPEKYPIITGWAPFLAGRRLSGRDQSFVTQKAIQSLALALGVKLENLERLLEGAYFHDWQSDPFSQGAYSYGKVGAVEAQKILASPIDETLFFAGEATDLSGNNGTVHGAIASGKRAADEILKTRRAAHSQ